MTIGKVDEPGPLTKLAITKSSKLKVKVKSQAEKSQAISGNVTEKKT